MWHATYTQVNQGDSRFLMTENQINNLTPKLYFDHDLCFKYPNGSCKPILDIWRAFQWYKELFNPMNFDPWKFWKSIGTLTPKVGVHLGVCGFIPSHSPTLLGAWNVTPMLQYWHAPLQALVLVASPRLGLQQWCIPLHLHWVPPSKMD